MELHEMLAGFRELRLQEHAKQNTHKLSYYVPLYVNYQQLLPRIRASLEQGNIAANLIWSVDEPANIGLLDVLPASAGKGRAIEFLMQQLEFGLQETVFAGDSGNDIEVMASPIQSVLVANASDDVRRAALRQARINRQTETLYLARGDYLGMNGNYSAGILEGVVHYLPQAEAWLRSES
jgi:hydroxymethylpyrimidine pyrophosphatase-like HAD family hydrolase